MTLTQTIRAFKIGVRVVLSFFVLFIVFKITVGIKNRVFPSIPPTVAPTPTPAPSFVFGRLKRPDLANVPLESLETSTFTLDLVKAVLPVSPYTITVYPVIPPHLGFLNLEYGKRLATKFGFSEEPTALSSTRFLWRQDLRSVEIDLYGLNFFYQMDYSAMPFLFVPGSFASQEEAKTLGINTLRDRGLLKPALANGSQEVQLLKFVQGGLVPTLDLREASAAQIDFYPASLNDLRVVSPKFIPSLVSLVISGVEDNPQTGEYRRLLTFRFTHWTVNQGKVGTYPLKAAEVAWQKLSEKKGFIVFLGDRAKREAYASVAKVEEFIVRDVDLVYLNAASTSDFIQPVWVFTGKATLASGDFLDWVGYVLGVEDAWLEEVHQE